MKCLFLAAGYATRLYPLTKNFPKPLLKVKDKTILDWLIDDLSNKCNIDDFIVVTNHKFVDIFSIWAKTHKQKITIVDDNTTTNENRLGAVKDINLAIKKANIDEDLIVLAGDNLVDFSFKSFIDYFNSKKATTIFRYYEKDIKSLSKRSTLSFLDNDLVTEMIEKPTNPTSNWCCPPFYIIKREDIKYIDKAIDSGINIDAPGSLFSYLVKTSKVYAMEMPGKRYDIGNLESYQNIQKEYNK